MVRTRALDDPSIDEATLSAWARHLGGRTPDVDELRASLTAGTLPHAFASAASGFGSTQAIDAGGVGASHAELDARAASVAAHLSSMGVCSGDRVLLVAAVGLEEIVAYLAILRLGATVVLANPSLTSAEIDSMRSVSGAEWLVASGTGLDGELTSRPWREVAGLRQHDSAASSVILDAGRGNGPAPRSVDPRSAAILAFTSGTTGAPKTTPLSHRNLLSSIRSVMMAWKWDRSDHLVHSLPISHQHGLGGVHATLLAGSRATLLGSFDAQSTLRTVVDGTATIHFGVPATYQRLLSRLGQRATGFAGLRLAISGSGPLPVDLANRYEELVGRTLLERYGTTESGLDVSNLYEGPRLAGSVGLPLPGVEAAVANDGGDVLAPGEVGQVLIRGPQVFAGYEGVSPSEQPFIGEWFRTGDVGRVDPETGFLQIVGRAKELIITGGMNVYPQELVDMIIRQPGVSDAAVVGVPSEEWGEEVVAVVSPADADTTALAATMRAGLAPYKRPKRYVTVAEIPRDHVGKLRVEELASLIPPNG